MSIADVKVVSDGIMVTFEDRSIAYFSANALHLHRATLGAQAFLDHDPTPKDSERDPLAGLEDAESFVDHWELTENGAPRMFAVVSPHTLPR